MSFEVFASGRPKHSAAVAAKHVECARQLWSDEDLFAALRRVHAHYGHLSVTTYKRAEKELGGLPAIALFSGRRFDTFNEAVTRAGLTPNAAYRTYERCSNASLLDAMLKVAAVLGEPPSYEKYMAVRAAHPEWGLPSGPTIRMRLGGWAAALGMLEALMRL